MCMILNIILLLSFAVELWMDYAIILDRKYSKKLRKKYAFRLISSIVIMFLVLMFLYHSFGVNSNNLGYYLEYGKVR